MTEVFNFKCNKEVYQFQQVNNLFSSQPELQHPPLHRIGAHAFMVLQPCEGRQAEEQSSVKKPDKLSNFIPRKTKNV